MKKRVALISVFLVLAIPLLAHAQERTTILKELLGPNKITSKVTAEKERFEIGVGAWPTTGRLDSFVYQPTGSEWIGPGDILRANPGDTISKLQNKLNSTMIIMDIGAYLFGFLYADASMGLGQFKGQHKDYDWWPQYRYDYTSLSYSSADGNTITWDANAELRCVDWNAGKSFIDLSLGYLYYRDSIVHLHDSTSIINNYVSTDTPIEGHDSQDKYTFDGFRIGSRCRWEIFDRVAFKGKAGVLPRMNAVNKGYWNLRQTQFLGTARGVAYDLMGGFEFRITKNFLVEAGYKYMYFKSYKGTQRTRSPGEETYSENGFSATASRGGFYFMGRLTM